MVSFLALHTAVYQRLVNDAAVKALVYKDTKFKGVYDAVPNDAPFPYIVIGEPAETPFSVKQGDTVETSLAIHTWSNKAGKTESYKLLQAVSDALAAFLIVTNYEVDYVKKVRTSVFDDIDGVLRHGVLTYEYTLTAKEQ